MVSAPAIRRKQEKMAYEKELARQQAIADAVAASAGRPSNPINPANMTPPAIYQINDAPKNAEFSDIFKAEEVGQEDKVDISKVQMFFFTIISAITYIVSLYNLIALTPTTDSFPELEPGLIALLTISHGAYLAKKAAPK